MSEFRSDLDLPQTDRLVRSILDASPNCILLLGRDGAIEFINEAGARLIEVQNPELFYGTYWIDHCPDASHAHAESALQTAQQGGHGSFTGLIPSGSGRLIWWDVTVSPLRDGSGGITQLVVISRDVTSTKQAFQDVDVARKNLAAVLSSTTDSIIAVDRDWKITYINDRASALVGRSGALTISKNLWDVYPEEVGSEFYKNYYRAVETQTPVHFEGYVSQLAIWLDVHAFPTDDGLSIFFRDVTDEKRSRDEIYYLAHHDALTGLPNRATFLKRLNAAQESATRASAALAVIYIDLDDFKAVNDTLGHDAGDAMLMEAARRLQVGLKGCGLVSRIGGDEFAILLEENADRLSAEQLVLELQRHLTKPVLHQSVELSCRASFGIALYPESDHRPSELMKNADLALYQAKRSGGNQYAFFDPRVRETMQKRISALSCARDALARDAIIPFYQPKVSFKTGRVTGFEALLRWVHPRDGIQPPFLIKDAFEDPILSTELGRSMLARVIQDMQLWRDNGLDFGSIAINVSAPEFVRRDLAAEVLSRLAAAQLQPTTLEIEVTETVFLDDGSDKVETALTELHRAGVSIALDDFGTGYASLTHLSKFPVSWLKIDRSFVSGLGVDPDATAIVNGVMGLSHSMGINVVAEGIETLEQWKLLKNKGCDLAQGYLINKPMSADLVPSFLENWSGVDGTTSTRTKAAKSRHT